MSAIDKLQQKIAGAKSQIEGMGAVLKIQYGPAAFALYKAYIDRRAFLELSGIVVGEYLPKSKYDLFLKAMDIHVTSYVELIVEAGAISNEVQEAVRAEVAKADMITIDLTASIETMLANLRPK